MFDFIEILYIFWFDMFTALNSYTALDLTLITETIGTQVLSLFDIIVFVATFISLLYVTRLTYRFITSMFKIVRGYSLNEKNKNNNSYDL